MLLLVDWRLVCMDLQSYNNVVKANKSPLTRMERVIRQISDLRELGRRLSIAGYRAGLHSTRWTAVPPLPVASQPVKRRA